MKRTKKSGFMSQSALSSLKPPLENYFNRYVRRYTGRYADFLDRNRKLIFSVTLAVWTLVSAYALLAYVPKYSSNASVLVKDSAIKALYLTSDPYSTTSSASASPVLNTMELLKSDKIPKELWLSFIQPNQEECRKLGLHNLTDWLNYYGEGKRFLQYKSVPGTDVITLGFFWDDPLMAREGLSALLQAFIKTSRELNQAEHHERSLYLALQEEDIRRKLSAVRQRISEFKRQHNTYDITKEMEHYTENRLTVEMAYKTALADANAFRSQLSAYQGTLGLSPKQAVLASAIGRNSTLSKLYEENYTLSEKYASLKPRYTANHPQVRQAASELAENEVSIQREITRITGKTAAPDAPVKQQAFADDTRSEAVKDMLQAQALSQGMSLKAAQMGNYLSKIDSRMQKLPEMEQVLSDLTEEADSLSQALSTLKQKTLEAKMREMQTLSNVFIINEPNLPTHPMPPTQLHLILLGLIGGLLGGVTLAFAKERYLKPVAPFDDIGMESARWRNGHDMDENVPVLKG